MQCHKLMSYRTSSNDLAHVIFILVLSYLKVGNCWDTLKFKMLSVMRRRAVIFTIFWSFLVMTISAQAEESCPTTEDGDTTFQHFSDYSCLGQCTLGVEHEQDHVCETNMCSEGILIPIVYKNGMFCVRGGQAVIDPTVVTTHCEIVPVIDKTTELQWKIAVSTGSLCKAICYNTAALLTSPSAFNVASYDVSSTDEGDGNNLHVLHIPAEAAYCVLEGSELTGDNENPGSESGECNLKYVLSETTHKEIPEVLARVTPLDEAVEHCGVSCMLIKSTVILKYMQTFTDCGRIKTFEDCPYCSLDQWRVVLPVSDGSNDIAPKCVLTRDSDNFWTLEIDGEPDVECSVQCSCYSQSNSQNKTDASVNTTT